MEAAVDVALNLFNRPHDVMAGTVKSRLFRARDALRERIESIDVPAKLLQTTVNGLENWAASLRQRLDDPDSVS